MNTNHKPPSMVTQLPEGVSAGREANPVIDDNPKQGTSRPPAIISTITPMEMLNAAVARGADLDVLTKLMDLQERWENAQARKAFDDAVAAAKAKIKPIPKNAEGHAGRRYADMAGIAKAIDPIITEYGLSYRFRTVQNDRNISVTCVLSHRAGHYEENTLFGPADVSGSKNAIQAIGSTLTYLQRYALIQALGLAMEETDDDGEGANAVRNGTSIAHPNDYDGGVPQRLTEPKKDPKQSRMEAADAHWREKIEGWMLKVDQLQTIQALDDWISNHSIQASTIPARHKDLQNAIYRKVRLKREELQDAASANQVVWDGDGAEPRPATPDDFERPSISERAIAARNKPDAELSNDEIADLLR